MSTDPKETSANRRVRCFIAFLVSIFLSCAATQALAQAEESTVSGRVASAAGSNVSGANVGERAGDFSPSVHRHFLAHEAHVRAPGKGSEAMADVP